MSRRRVITALSGAVAIVASALTLSAAPAQAVDPNIQYSYFGSAGGTFVKAVGGAVRSDLTAPTVISGSTYPASQNNTIASADVDGVASVGVIETSATATKNLLGGLNQTSKVTTAGVSLLGGLIEADAVETTSQARRVGTTLSGEAKTKLVNLSISGQDVPLSISANLKIEIPGIAEVTLNESKVTEGPGTIKVEGSAIKVRLLDGDHGAPAGTVIMINPVVSQLIPTVPVNATAVGGFAYGTYVAAKAGSGIDVVSGPTARTEVPVHGTFGYPITNSTLAVDLGRTLRAGAVESMSKASSVPVTADISNTNEVAKLNLLGGAVTADSVKVTANLKKNALGVVTKSQNLKFVNLKVAGIKIGLNIKPNTKIEVPGLARIVLNEQITTPTSTTIFGIHITLSVPLPGLPVGSEIHVAVASSFLR